MAYGLAPKLTLTQNAEDGAYKLLKTVPDIAKQNLKMLVLTAPGERVMEPEFGVGLRRYLFELENTGLSSTIKQRIFDQALKYLPYLQISSVEIETTLTSPNVPENSMAVRITYFVPSAGASAQRLDVKVS
jgi:phage baseplate assembly protein W|tara:strand:- start:2413 stop:2805 length:393 start_codon:yes stop_codon:yes gene_type:complete